MAKKLAELQDLNAEDLAQKMGALEREMFNLRMQRAEGKLTQPHLFRRARRDAARVMTLLRQKSTAAPVKAKS